MNKITKIIIGVVLIAALVAGGIYFSGLAGNSGQGLLRSQKKSNTEQIHNKSKAKQFCTYAYDSSLGATYANCLTNNSRRVQIDFCYVTGCFTTTGVDYSCGDFKGGRCPIAEAERAKTM